ncbi:anti-repressor SinI family protein [Neobacillus sp. SAB-20_R2A]
METILSAEEEIDSEWVDLILEALNIGITADEIRNFLKIVL